MDDLETDDLAKAADVPVKVGTVVEATLGEARKAVADMVDHAIVLFGALANLLDHVTAWRSRPNKKKSKCHLSHLNEFVYFSWVD